jgi:transcriptional regulator with XRE-family HTH domain
MSLGKNIRRMRRDKGWTQGQLADRAGIKLNHVSKLEQDDTDPKLSTLYKLMQAFSCSPDSLLMDLNRVSTDAILKQTLERATALPEDDKVTIIRVVDAYCMAAGLRQQFTPENKLPFGISLYRDAPKGVLEDRPDSEARPKTSENAS